MLSILIPVYNYNVFPLAQQLETQALQANIVFEIICIDDGSLSETNQQNEQINNLKAATFIANSNNIGLSNNRNLLASKAQYDNLLFIDGDSLLPQDNFIKNYVDALKHNTDVIYGGRIHPKGVGPNRKLRWKYGIFKEDQSVEQRNKNPYKCVLFNNTLIKKEVFQQIGFEKNITEYGHEDTIFAYKLQLKKAKILHINNPVLHNDVDLNEVYLEKTKKGLNNLNYIYNKKLVDPQFITFLVYFEKLKQFKMHIPLAFAYKLWSWFFTKNLRSAHPNLFIFDLFRLSYFCHINTKR